MHRFSLNHGLRWSAAVVALAVVGQTAGAATLINHYQFEGDLTDSAGSDDISKGGEGLEFADGVFGQAISFDGADDYLQIATQRFTDPFTLAMFIKAGPLDSGLNLKVLAANSGTGARTPGFRWHYRDSGSLRVETANGGDTGSGNDYTDPGNDYFLARSGSGVIVADQWQHVAMRLDQSAGLVDFFVDGVKLDLGDHERVVLDFPLINDAVWRLGAMASGSGSYFFNGLMDDVRLYDGALTDGEIASLAVIPEPGTAGLCLAAVGGLTMLRRRRAGA